MTTRQPSDSRDRMFSQQLPDFQVAWDATSLASFMTCPRRYQYEILQGHRRQGAAAALEFGRVMHAALEVYDQCIARGAPADTAELVMVWWALAGTWRPPFTDTDWTKPPDIWQASPDKSRTRTTLLRCLVWYTTEAPSTPIRPLLFPFGPAATEVAFCLPIQSVAGERITLVGYLDGVCAFGDPGDPDADVFIRERKHTTTTLSAYYFNNYTPNVQVDTYDLIGSRLFANKTVRGVLLEAIQVGVTMSRTGRQPLYRTEAQRAEWMADIEGVIAQAHTYAQNGFWPMNRAVCSLYGGCPYRRVCGSDPAARATTLAANFERQLWDPTEAR